MPIERTWVGLRALLDVTSGNYIKIFGDALCVKWDLVLPRGEMAMIVAGYGVAIGECPRISFNRIIDHDNYYPDYNIFLYD